MNVEAGDDAYLVGTVLKANMGAPVHVESWNAKTSQWFVTSKTPLACKHPTKDHSYRGLVSDCNLRRIAGPSITVGTETEKLVEENA